VLQQRGPSDLELFSTAQMAGDALLAADLRRQGQGHTDAPSTATISCFVVTFIAFTLLPSV
jgi:hypothetical protein